MYLPCLVFPYHLSPSRWKTLVSVLTQTIPFAGGAGWLVAWACEAGAGLLAGCSARLGSAGAGLAAAAGFAAGAMGLEAAGAAPTTTRDWILPIVLLETPAFARSSTEE